MLSSEIIDMVSQQGTIGVGEKAIVYQNRLWCDHVYTATGEAGRCLYQRVYISEEDSIEKRKQQA
jgi:hypothetical protein